MPYPTHALKEAGAIEAHQRAYETTGNTCAFKRQKEAHPHLSIAKKKKRREN